MTNTELLRSSAVIYTLQPFYIRDPQFLSHFKPLLKTYLFLFTFKSS